MRNFKRYLELCSALMAVLVIIASSGFAYSSHFCHGSRTATSFYGGLYNDGNPCSCGPSGSEMSSAHSSSVPEINKFHCCKNKQFFEKILTVSFSIDCPDIVPNAPVNDQLYSASPVEPVVLNEPEPYNHGPDRTLPDASLSLATHFHHLRIPLSLSDC